MMDKVVIERSELDAKDAEIERLRAALKVARQWMPIEPLGPMGKSDVAIVDAALEPPKARKG